MICNILVPLNLNDLDNKRLQQELIFYFRIKIILAFWHSSKQNLHARINLKKIVFIQQPTGTSAKETKWSRPSRPLEEMILEWRAFILLFKGINGRKEKHVLTNLANSIFSADFLQRQHISYNAYTRSLNWADQHESWTNAVFFCWRISYNSGTVNKGHKSQNNQWPCTGL